MTPEQDEARQTLMAKYCEFLDDEDAVAAMLLAVENAKLVATAAGGRVLPDREWHWQDDQEPRRRTSLHVFIPGQWETAGAAEDIEEAIGPRILDGEGDA